MCSGQLSLLPSDVFKDFVFKAKAEAKAKARPTTWDQGQGQGIVHYELQQLYRNYTLPPWVVVTGRLLDDHAVDCF